MDRRMHAVSRGAPTFPFRNPAAERVGRDHFVSTGHEPGLAATGIGRVAPGGALGGRAVARGVFVVGSRV